MNKNIKRSVAIVGIIAASSVAMTACSETGKEGSSDAPKIEGLSNTTGQLVAEGASSQQNALDLFGKAYGEAVPGAQFSYNPSGSGAGQKQFIAKQVAFGGSDSPMNEEQAAKAKERCGGNDAWHLPMVVGPVAVAYNLEGVDNLVLTPELIAKIFKGEIKKWNDPAIAAVNKDAKLPDSDISVLYRSEESGTSDNFQKFLKASAPQVWDTTGKQFPSGVGSGANGSKGVTDQVKQTPGAITYVESGFAKDSNLGITDIDFGKGPVKLSNETVNNALQHVKYKGEGHDMIVDSNALFAQKEADSYPLALTTYELVCSAGYDAQTRDMVKDFLKVALHSQDDSLSEAGYVPVSGEYKGKLEAAVDAMK